MKKSMFGFWEGGWSLRRKLLKQAVQAALCLALLAAALVFVVCEQEADIGSDANTEDKTEDKTEPIKNPQPQYTLRFLEVSQGWTVPVTEDVTEYQVKGIPFGKETVTITAVSTAGDTRTEEVTLSNEEQTVELDGGYKVIVPAKLMEAPVPEENNDVTINVTIAVRVIAPEGVMEDKIYENTYGLASNNRSNGIHTFWIQQGNNVDNIYDPFYTSNFTDNDIATGLAFNYDTVSGLWVYEAGEGTITRYFLICPYDFEIWDDWKESGNAGGFKYDRSFADRPFLIEEEGDVYLFYTVTLRNYITVEGTVTVGGESTDVSVNSPALYTVAPDTNGKGVAAHIVKASPITLLSPSHGAFKLMLEDFDESTQVWFIPGIVKKGTSWGTPQKNANFGFEPFYVHNTDITDLVFNIESIQ